MGKFARLFVIKNRIEACAVIYALALGAIERGLHYLDVYPGYAGWMLMTVCPIAVVMAGSRLLESVRPDSKQRRRKSDYFDVLPKAANGNEPMPRSVNDTDLARGRIDGRQDRTAWQGGEARIGGDRRRNGERRREPRGLHA